MEDMKLQFDILGITSCQRNRYPMLFVDRITECVPLKYAKGYKLFTYDEWYFNGYETSSPKAWTVVKLEAMSQVFLMTFLSTECNRGKIAMSNKFNNLRIFRDINPGDKLNIEATLDSYRRGIAKGKAIGTINNSIACSVECTIAVPADFTLIRPDNISFHTNSDYKLPESDLEFGIEEIQKCMLNKYPFQYLDRVLAIEPGKYVHAIKNFSYNEWFFPYHFDDDPSVPGFIQIETCLQAFLLTFLSLDEFKRMETTERLLNNIQLRRKIIPGDTLEIKSVLNTFSHGVGQGYVESFVNGEKACSFEVTACIPGIALKYKV